MSTSSNSINLTLSADLRAVQLESFYHFLIWLLPCELKQLNEFVCSIDAFECHILGDRYSFEEPSYSPLNAVAHAETYGSRLHVPICLYNKEINTYETQTVFLGVLPFMTVSGNFILKGLARCIVSQLIRSPGLYYTLSNDNHYLATIISDTGKRLKLKLHTDQGIYVIFQNNATIHLLTLLLALGLPLDQIPYRLKSKLFFPGMIDILRSLPSSSTEALWTVLSMMKVNTVKLREEDTPLHDGILQDYSLGRIGRWNLNRRLGLSRVREENELTVEDLLFTALSLIDCMQKQTQCDDIDDLKYKRLKRIGDVMYEHILLGFISLKKKMHSILVKRTTSTKLVSPLYFVHLPVFHLERLLGLYQLSQLLDQTNPLADLVHKRKVSALGPGGLTARTARFRVRDLHLSQYGRICPIETAEGEKAGLITALSTVSAIDEYGSIRSMTYNLRSKAMQGNAVYRMAHDDEYSQIGTGRILDTELTPAQQRRQLITLPWHTISHRSLCALQFFAIGVGLIPFVEHNDSTRALMGSNMQRQAVGLLTTVQPVVGTGLEAAIGLDSTNLLLSSHPAYIEAVDSRRLVWRDLMSNHIYHTHLINYMRLNNNIPSNQKTVVHTGDYVQAGQLLADTNATVGGELCLGQNILVAYMPWEGYNFEDAILISERLVEEEVFTSMYIKRYHTEIRAHSDISEFITRDIPQLSPYVLRHLNPQGLVNIGHYVEDGDVLVGKVIEQGDDENLYGPETKLLQEIFGLQNINTQDSSLKVPPRGGGRVIDVRLLDKEELAAGTIHRIYVYVLQQCPIQVGDKLAGRHGNKGVVAQILSRSAMPYLPDGTPVDMILSPLGVPSRMNVGQILECLLGFSGVILRKHYRILPFDERYEAQASRKLVLSELYGASRNKPWVFDVHTPGKIRLFDGRTGHAFDQSITVGRAYMLKLIHQVAAKIHARSTGPYAIITQQPLRGKSRKGGQRVGEMEVWAFQGFGAAYTLQELLTLKSDHLEGRATAIRNIIQGQSVPFFDTASDCLRTFIRELWGLALDVRHLTISASSGQESQKML